MKNLHKPNLFCWSTFDEDRNIDFHSYVWKRESGVVVIDPLPLTDHDEAHLLSLGSVTHIIISNSDHVRAAESLAAKTGALVWGPKGEKDSFPIACSDWLGDGDTPMSGLKVYVLNGSKTPGELALLLEKDTLVTGDLIRGHEGGRLNLLKDKKLGNKRSAIEAVTRLADISTVDAILPGDGWPVFRDGHKALAELVDTLNFN